MIKPEELRVTTKRVDSHRAEGERRLMDALVAAQLVGRRELTIPLNQWQNLSMGFYLEHGGLKQMTDLGYSTKVTATTVKIGW